MNDSWFNLSGWLLAGLAFAGLAWALFSDAVRQRFRRYRRCPKCWFDLSHTAGLRCNECGYLAGTERSLHRFRTRRCMAVLSLLLLIAADQVRRIPDIRDHGWAAAVPTTVLIYLVPAKLTLQPPTPDSFANVKDAPWWKPPRWLDSLYRSLRGRVGRNEVWGWQRTILVTRCLERTNTEIISIRGDRHYGEIYYLLETVYINLPANHPDSRRICRVVAHSWSTRPLWPENVPISATVWLEPFPWTGETRLELTPADDRFHRVAYLRLDPHARIPHRWSMSHDVWDDGNVTLTDAAPPGGPYYFDAHFIRSGHAQWPVNRVRTLSWNSTVMLPIEVKGTIGDYLTPVKDERLTASIRDLLKPHISFAAGEPHLVVRFDPFYFWSDNGNPLTVALIFSIRRNGVEVATAFAWWNVIGGSNFVLPSASRIRLTPAPGYSEDIFTQPGEWEVEIRSDPALALRNFDCDRYWDGNLTLPLPILDDAPKDE